MIIAVIVALAVSAQVLADRYRVPSVRFLILAGVAVGPEGVGLVTRESFGPALSNWMTELGRSGDVQEIEVTAEALVGRSISDIDADILDEVLIALVARDGESTVPRGDFELEYGDHITILGRTDAVAEAIDSVHPHV